MAVATATVLTAISVASSLASSFAQAQAQDYNTEAQIRQQQAAADAAEYNQKIAQQNAELVGQQTQAALEKQDRERRLRMGAARAASGASGIGLENFGDILQSSAAQEELDLLTIQSEGALRQREFTTQSDLLGAQAAGARSQVPLIKSASRASKAATVLSGISKGVGSF